MGQKKNVDMSLTQDSVKIVKEAKVAADSTTNANQGANGKSDGNIIEGSAENSAPKKATPKQKRSRSPKYQAVRAQVDKTRQYDPFSAIELVKKLSYSSFPGTIVADLVLLEKFLGERINIQFPHSTGKSLTVAIADDKVLKKIAAGEIDFDILLASPEMMPKITKHARVLGPQGLMPNPKQGTLTPNPQAKKKELESGKLTLRTERKAPLMHVVIGKTQMETKDLVENLKELVAALKGKIDKLSLSATMSPGIKVAVEK